MFGSAKSGNNNQDGFEHNIFFEGGEIEFGIEFEGGSDEDAVALTEGIDGAAETIRSKKGKKKGKKKRATSSQRGFGNQSFVSGGNLTEGEEQVRDLDNDNKSIKSGRSRKSLGKKKKKTLTA